MLKRAYPFILLFLFWVFLYIGNLSFGHYLLGWDSLQTELNPLLGVKRALFSSWQEYQSFGLAAGMGHAADLVRALFVGGLSIILPQSLVRYTFTMLMVLLGLFGMFRLLKRTLSYPYKTFFASFGAIAYVLNFYLIQLFFLPFETFSIFAGFLPWLIDAYWWVLKRPTPKAWIFFVVINLLATPFAVAQQLFVVYCLTLGLVSLGLIFKRPILPKLKITFIALLLILGIHSFWIIPQAYFLETSGYVVTTSKINQLATSDVLFRNKDKGTISDLLTNTGFFYESVGIQSQPLFLSWKMYRDLPFITTITYFFGLLAFIGMLKPSRLRIPFLILFSFCAFTLLSNTPPFSTVNDIIRQQNFINQVFRSPFTKFSIPLSVAIAYFTTFGAFLVAQLIAKMVKKYDSVKVIHTVGSILLLLLLISKLPAFWGGYISPDMQIELPDSYTQAIDYFKTVDKNQRIGLLPEYTFWGWEYTNWGYNGSGFLWYGIEQPIVSRTFDVWSEKSEGYYWEMRTALENEDPKQIVQVLDKYDVDYLLLDKSMLPLASSAKAIQYDKLGALLQSTPSVTLEKTWGNLELYHVTHPYATQDFISIARNVPSGGPSVFLTADDTLYQTLGTYKNASESADIIAPFLDLTTQTHLPEKSWQIKELDNSFLISSSAQNHLPTTSSEGSQSAYLVRDGKIYEYAVPFDVRQTSTETAVVFPKVGVSPFTPTDAHQTACSVQKGNPAVTLDSAGAFHIRTENGAYGCITYSDASLDQAYGYIVRVETAHQEGQTLYFYILDQTKEQALVEDRLSPGVSYYILPARSSHGLGYSFTFQNDSLPTAPSENVIKNITVYLAPYNQIKDLTIRQNDASSASFEQNGESHKESYYQYSVLVPAHTSETVILHQSYHPGWIAFSVPSKNIATITLPFLFGSSIPTHEEINGWENGWDLQAADSDTYLILYYWPQLLEYLGLISMTTIITSTIALYLKNKRHKKSD